VQTGKKTTKGRERKKKKKGERKRLRRKKVGRGQQGKEAKRWREKNDCIQEKEGMSNAVGEQKK